MQSQLAASAHKNVTIQYSEIFLESSSNCKDGVQWNCERGDMGLCVYRIGSTRKWNENDCNLKRTFACKKALRHKCTYID